MFSRLHGWFNFKDTDYRKNILSKSRYSDTKGMKNTLKDFGNCQWVRIREGMSCTFLVGQFGSEFGVLPLFLNFSVTGTFILDLFKVFAKRITCIKIC